MLTANEIKIHELFEELVPPCGKADTVAGEIVRAISRLGYRWHNDGDMIGVGYGKETCNASARYLVKACDARVGDAVANMWGDGSRFHTYEKYEMLMQKLNEEVISYLEEHPELKQAINEEDMFDYYDKYEDVDDSDEDEDWWI